MRIFRRFFTRRRTTTAINRGSGRLQQSRQQSPWNGLVTGWTYTADVVVRRNIISTIDASCAILCQPKRSTFCGTLFLFACSAYRQTLLTLSCSPVTMTAQLLPRETGMNWYPYLVECNRYTLHTVKKSTVPLTCPVIVPAFLAAKSTQTGVPAIAAVPPRAEAPQRPQPRRVVGQCSQDRPHGGGR